MTKSLKKEILRKFIHLLEIPVLLGYGLIRFYWSEQVAILILTALLLILLEIEYVRLEMRPKFPEFLNLFRAREHDNVTSTVFFVIATIIVFATFDYTIAMLALLLTVFGDLASALVGIKFGKRKIFWEKTLEGLLAGFATNLLVGFLMIPMHPIVFIPMAIVASVVEILTHKLDDNLTVPLFAGFAGQMIVYIFGIQLLGFPYPFEWLYTLFNFA